MQENNNIPLISFNNVYLMNQDKKLIFKKLTFNVSKNENIFILGHRDKERTLILYSMLGLIRPMAGDITIFGENLKKHSEINMLNMRKRIGYVHAQKGLINNISIKDNIALPLRFNSRYPNDKIEEKIKEISNLFKLENILKKDPWELDNLSRKKILFTRAVINRPRLLLIDEPTTYIEKKDVKEIINMIVLTIEEKLIPDTASLIITSEDEFLAKKLADKILLLNEGFVEHFDSAKNIFHFFGKEIKHRVRKMEQNKKWKGE